MSKSGLPDCMVCGSEDNYEFDAEHGIRMDPLTGGGMSVYRCLSCGSEFLLDVRRSRGDDDTHVVFTLLTDHSSGGSTGGLSPNPAS